MARVRKLAGQKRVGHAGTLDPMATGVLPVLLGRATRLVDFVQSGTKTYVADVRLGAATETDDAESAVTSEAPVPALNRALLEDTLARFVGDILQKPPKYSALKVDGQRAYALARGGAAVDLSARTVTIHALQLLEYSDARLCLEVTCSKGTYIRALARDIAEALGTLGHLVALRRTRVGPFTLAEALTLEDIAVRGVASAVLPASLAVPEAPRFCASSEEAGRLLNGQPVEARGLHAESVWVYDPLDRLIGLGFADGLQLRPRLAL